MMSFPDSVEPMSRRIEVGRKIRVGSLNSLNVTKGNEVIRIAEVRDRRAARPAIEPADNILSVVAG